MDSVRAFAAIGLTAVAWDGQLTKAGVRTFRHALDYREPYCNWTDMKIIDMIHNLLALRQSKGNKNLMLEAAKSLTPLQSLTAYAMASEIMRSDGPYTNTERKHLDHLAIMLDISTQEVKRIDSVIDILHSRLALESSPRVPKSGEVLSK